MRRRLWLTIPVAVAAPLVVVGLLQGPDRPAAVGTPSDPRPFGGVSYFSADEHTVLHQATERLISECMRARGQEYWPVPRDDRAAATASPYLLLDAEQARTDGYGITAAAVEPRSTPRNDEVVAALPAHDKQRWQDALTGTRRESITLADGPVLSYPTDGCVFLAGERLYGSGWTRLSLKFQGLANSVIEATGQNTEVVRATAEWAACMRAAGHPYVKLSDPRGDVTTRLGTAGHREAGRFELRVATQDAACQQRARLPETVATAQESAETLTEADRADLHRLRAMRTDALARAVKHVAAGSDERGEHTW
jgi:hypothetical protein